jgi:hypothetical protein
MYTTYYIQHGEVILYRNTTIQYINTLINIKYAYYIQHSEVLYSCISVWYNFTMLYVVCSIHILYLLMYLCIL